MEQNIKEGWLHKGSNSVYIILTTLQIILKCKMNYIKMEK
jgi:hypothetical protein